MSERAVIKPNDHIVGSAEERLHSHDASVQRVSTTDLTPQLVENALPTSMWIALHSEAFPPRFVIVVDQSSATPPRAARNA
ncbi:hypothetical protein ACFWEJ_12520 [Promicromonospora sp. NPDC060204]|uniref:hypothetical protein n=1 Tax=Promicromonospora sp. NPDC060204 TaxID=3347071 RepID=UPI00366A2A26